LAGAITGGLAVAFLPTLALLGGLPIIALRRPLYAIFVVIVVVAELAAFFPTVPGKNRTITSWLTLIFYSIIFG
jgi:hypothetical protein